MTMHQRTRYRVHAIPLLFVVAAAVAIATLLLVPQVSGPLRNQSPWLPWIAAGIVAVVPLAFAYWYTFSFAEVLRGRLRLRSIRSSQVIDLRSLVNAEVYARSTKSSKRRSHELSLFLEDAAGKELHLPLNSWRDEELLMARVLRATVECKVRIDGDPVLVDRFAGLLNSYKSWDRQQAA